MLLSLFYTHIGRREGKREGGKEDRERERERDRVCVCHISPLRITFTETQTIIKRCIVVSKVFCWSMVVVVVVVVVLVVFHFNVMV